MNGKHCCTLVKTVDDVPVFLIKTGIIQKYGLEPFQNRTSFTTNEIRTKFTDQNRMELIPTFRITFQTIVFISQIFIFFL